MLKKAFRVVELVTYTGLFMLCLHDVYDLVCAARDALSSRKSTGAENQNDDIM